MANTCEYCNKKYTTKGNLVKHQRTAKYCLEIQEQINGENSDKIEVRTFNCEYCIKKFSQKSHLLRHTPLCLEKYKFEIQKITKNSIDKDNEISKLKSENDELRDELKTVAYETELRILRERDERSMSTVEEIAKQPRINTTTNTQNKIIITTPLDLSKENLLSVIESGFDNNYLVQGQKGVARFAYEKILKDDEGKLKYICTDPSRQVFQYKNEDGKIQKDVRATKLTKALFDAELKKTSHKIAWDVMKDDDDEVFSEFNDHYQSIRSMEQNNCEFSKELSCLAV